MRQDWTIKLKFKSDHILFCSVSSGGNMVRKSGKPDFIWEWDKIKIY